MFKIIKVDGDSLLPNIRNGDFLLVRTFYKKYRIGTIIVLHHPRFGRIVKRVCELLENGSCMVESTHPKGISRNEIGQVSPQQIIGISIFHIKQKKVS